MTPTWDYPTPFTQPIHATKEDADELGHVNNATYINWCESLAWAHSKTLGLGPQDYVAMDRAMAIHRAEYDYLQALYPGDEIIAATWLLKSDLRLSIERCFQLINRHSGSTVFRGKWQLVCVNLSTGKPARIPPQFTEIYKQALVETP